MTTDKSTSFQERVIAELIALSGNVARLEVFLDTPVFAGLPKDERGRLVVQLRFMQGYEAVLLQRIEAFQGVAP